MKVKYILFSMGLCCLFMSNVKATSYDKQIANLQKQINELNKNKKQEVAVDDSLSINGRIAVLGNFYSADSSFDLNTNDLYSKFSLKQARLAVSKIIDNFLIYFEVNYTGNQVYLGQVFIDYLISDKSELMVGQIAAPAFMENQKHSSSLAVSTFSTWMDDVPAYLLGINYAYSGDKAGFAAGVFGNGVDQEGTAYDTSFTSALRAFYTPIRNDNAVLHFGVDFLYRNLTGDTEINGLELSETYYYGLEFAAQYKAITFENEFINSFNKFDENAGLGNSAYSSFGFSNQLIVSFTGDKRVYDKYGSFNFPDVKNPISKGGYGALEGVLKFSRFFGKDKGVQNLTNAGTGYEFTAGLNWFPISNVMLLMNYSFNKDSKIVSDKKEYSVYRLEARMYF